MLGSAPGRQIAAIARHSQGRPISSAILWIFEDEEALYSSTQPPGSERVSTHFQVPMELSESLKGLLKLLASPHLKKRRVLGSRSKK
jgi:hypothetical protein